MLPEFCVLDSRVEIKMKLAPSAGEKDEYLMFEHFWGGILQECALGVRVYFNKLLAKSYQGNIYVGYSVGS